MLIAASPSERAIGQRENHVKIKSLIAACAVLAVPLGAAIAPAEAQPMMMHHHMMHHSMMYHHMMHHHHMMMYRPMMHHHPMMHRAM